MSQEIGLLSVFDGGRLKEPPSLGRSLLRWALIIPQLVALALLIGALSLTSVLSVLAVLLAARFPQKEFDFEARLRRWTWKLGFFSLEEFTHRNWANIDWGSALDLYSYNKHTGRRFPAGPWTIDFLARDADTNDLVVVQLKREDSSDSAVGQLLRYISWVKENIAADGQNVRGLIVARKDDAALEYAVRNLPFVEVKTYDLDFQLKLKQGVAPTYAKPVEKSASEGAEIEEVSEPSKV